MAIITGNGETVVSASATQPVQATPPVVAPTPAPADLQRGLREMPEEYVEDEDRGLDAALLNVRIMPPEDAQVDERDAMSLFRQGMSSANYSEAYQRASTTGIIPAAFSASGQDMRLNSDQMSVMNLQYKSGFDFVESAKMQSLVFDPAPSISGFSALVETFKTSYDSYIDSMTSFGEMFGKELTTEETYLRRQTREYGSQVALGTLGASSWFTSTGQAAGSMFGVVSNLLTENPLKTASIIGAVAALKLTGGKSAYWIKGLAALDLMRSSMGSTYQTAFDMAIAQGATLSEARDIAFDLGMTAGVASGLLEVGGAAAGLKLMTGVGRSLISKEATTVAVSSIATRVRAEVMKRNAMRVAGTVAEETFTEMGQAVAEQYTMSAAAKAAGGTYDADYWSAVAEAAKTTAQGMGVISVIGGAAGMPLAMRRTKAAVAEYETKMKETATQIVDIVEQNPEMLGTKESVDAARAYVADKTAPVAKPMVSVRAAQEALDANQDGWTNSPNAKQDLADVLGLTQEQYDAAYESDQYVPFSLESMVDLAVSNPGLARAITNNLTAVPAEVLDATDQYVTLQKERVETDLAYVQAIADKMLDIPGVEQGAYANAVMINKIFEGIELGSGGLRTRNELIDGITFVDVTTKRGEKHAQIRWDAGEGYQATIDVFQDARPDTVMHEMTHYTRRVMADLYAILPDNQLKKDIDTLNKAVGATDTNWTEAQEEALAKMMEEYLITGKAPNKELAPIFSYIKNAILVWYKETFTKDADAYGKLTPEVHAVFDRLLNTNSAAQAYRDSIMGHMFPEDVSEETISKFNKQLGEALDDVDAQVSDQLGAQLLAESEDFEAIALREAENNPRRIMINNIIDQGGFNRSMALSEFGEEAVARADRNHPGLINEDGRLAPADYANELGMETGTMWQDVEATLSLDDEIAARAQVMEAEYMADNPLLVSPSDADLARLQTMADYYAKEAGVSTIDAEYNNKIEENKYSKVIEGYTEEQGNADLIQLQAEAQTIEQKLAELSNDDIETNPKVLGQSRAEQKLQRQLDAQKEKTERVQRNAEFEANLAEFDKWYETVELMKKIQLAVVSLEAKHKQELEKAKNKSEAQKAKLKEKHVKQLADLNTKHQNQIAALRTKFNERIAKAEAAGKEKLAKERAANRAKNAEMRMEFALELIHNKVRQQMLIKKLKAIGSAKSLARKINRMEIGRDYGRSGIPGPILSLLKNWATRAGLIKGEAIAPVMSLSGVLDLIDVEIKRGINVPEWLEDGRFPAKEGKPLPFDKWTLLEIEDFDKALRELISAGRAIQSKNFGARMQTLKRNLIAMIKPSAKTVKDKLAVEVMERGGFSQSSIRAAYDGTSKGREYMAAVSAGVFRVDGKMNLASFATANKVTVTELMDRLKNPNDPLVQLAIDKEGIRSEDIYTLLDGDAKGDSIITQLRSRFAFFIGGELDFDSFAREKGLTRDELFEQLRNKFTPGIKAARGIDDVAKSYWARTIKAETVLRLIDGTSDSDALSGTAHKAIYQPLDAANTDKIEVFEDIVPKIKAAYAKIPPELRKGIKANLTGRIADKMTTMGLSAPTGWTTDRVYIPGTPYANGMTMEERYVVCLNAGNEGGRNALISGNGFTPEGIQNVIDSMPAEIWDSVEAMWEAVGGLWDRLQDVSRRGSGVELEFVNATPFTATINGKQRKILGGYFPMTFDRSTTTGQNKEYNPTETFKDLRASFGEKRSPRSDASYNRQNGNKRPPILLNLGVIDKHIVDVVHDITHRLPVQEVAMYIYDKNFQQFIAETYGPEYNKEIFQDWITHVASPRYKPTSGLGEVAEWARRNTTVATMAGRISVGVMQLAGFFQTWDTLGSKWLLMGITDTMTDSDGGRNAIIMSSAEMRDRTRNPAERDLQDIHGSGDLFGKSAMATFKDNAMKVITTMDMVVAKATWWGAYQKALSEGKSDALARKYGDQVVRTTQPLNAPKDSAAVQHGGIIDRLLSMYMTFFSGLLNRLILQYGRAKATGHWEQLAMTVGITVVFPAILDWLVSNREVPDDPEDWKDIAFGTVSYAVSGMPIFRDIMNSATAGTGYRASPVSQGVSTIIRGLQQNEWNQSKARNVMTGLGYVFGIPATGQFRATWRGLETLDIDRPSTWVDPLLGPPRR